MSITAPPERTTATSRAEQAKRLPYFSRANLDHIPGEQGPPVFGHMLSFVFSTQKLIDRMTSRYGATFRGSMMGEPLLFVGDPDDIRTVLLDKKQNFSNRMGWRNGIGELFSNGLMLRDFEEHRIHRAIMMSAFRADALRSYVDMMNPLITDGLNQWESKLARDGSMMFYPNIKNLTLNLASEVFLGLELGQDADRVNRAFVDMVKASIAVVKKEVPLLSYRKGMNGRRYLVDFIGSQISERRGTDRADMFSRFCNAVDEEGHQYSDQDIIDHMIFLLMAAHDTTTSSATILVWCMAQYPEWQERLRKEVMELPPGPMQYDDADRMPDFELAFKEALRMYPPVPFISRRSVDECELSGNAIPSNTPIVVVSMISHFLSEYWTEPRSFDPERFAPPREEHRRHSHSYFPFGGGAHTCIGMQFAILQVKAFMVQLLRKYRIRLKPKHEVKIRPIPIPFPADGLPVILEKIDN